MGDGFGSTRGQYGVVKKKEGVHPTGKRRQNMRSLVGWLVWSKKKTGLALQKASKERGRRFKAMGSSYGRQKNGDITLIENIVLGKI